MGISQLLKDQPVDQLTPGRAFIVSLLFMISADKEIDGEEIAYLLTILGGEREHGSFTIRIEDPDILNWAISYRSRTSVDKFLHQISSLLTSDQKRCLLLNLIDCASVDGEFEPQEQEMFDKFLEALEIPYKEIKAWADTIFFKNSYRVFFSEYDTDKTC